MVIKSNDMLKDIKGTVKIEDLSEEQIRELQRRLEIQQTGIMGPMTRKAWEDWKRSKGMGEPGLIGPGSIGLLLGEIDWTDMTSKVSKYFTVREVTKGQAARIPTSKVIQDNIVRLAKELDKIREEWGKPIIVTSWYRPLTINRAVGGVDNSQHIQGLAVDIAPIDPAELIEFERWLDEHWYGPLGWGAQSGRGFTHLGLTKGWRAGGKKGPRWRY